MLDEVENILLNAAAGLDAPPWQRDVNKQDVSTQARRKAHSFIGFSVLLVLRKEVRKEEIDSIKYKIWDHREYTFLFAEVWKKKK